MSNIRFNKSLYPKIALIKAAYNFTDRAYVHLDMDDYYYIVQLTPKDGSTDISGNEFLQEMLAQTVRHEVYLQTKNIRELLLARALATSVVTKTDFEEETEEDDGSAGDYLESDILKDWYLTNEGNDV